MSGGGKLKRQATEMKREEFPGLVKQLSSAPAVEKDTLAHLVDILVVHDKSNPAALVKAGAIKPLVELCATGNDSSQIHAASALATIAATKYEYQDMIIDGGGIAPLCTLLRMGSNKANCFAAAAIASLADQPKHQEPIIKAGACQPLVRLVRDDVTVDTQLHASDAIADLSDKNPKAQKIFFGFGAVPLLLALLKGGKANVSAAKALAKMLSPAGGSDQANSAVQEEIARDGGIAPLLALLSGMSTQAAVYAAEALSRVAQGNPGTQATITKSGGIAPLLAMISAKSTTPQQAQAASALGQLARFNRENQDAISRARGIPLLMALLSSHVDTTVQAMAAMALTEVCRGNRESQAAAAACGCISSLVEQVRASGSGLGEVKAEAVGAIWVLSEDHASNKVAIAKAGGIQPTVALLASGTARAQQHAASALASLGLDNVDNQIAIMTLLVSLLSVGAPEAKANATALLWRLVSENPSTRQGMAEAGPLNDLIGLLKSGTPEARKFALWSLSLSIHETNQTVLLEEDAVGPLVDALSSPEAVIRQQAAAAVTRLAVKNAKAQQAVAAKGGIAPLIHIVKGGGPKGVEPAAQEEGVAPPSAAAEGGSKEDGGGKAPPVAPTVVDAFTATPQETDLNDQMEARRYAASALSDLANLPKISTQIVAEGGIAPLVQLLQDGGKRSIGAVARRPYRSESKEGQIGGSDSSGKQFAATAIARLANGNEEASVEIAAAGAIAPLVNLLSGLAGDAAQEESAGALFSLAGEVGNRVAITDAGGIGPLVTLLGSDNSTTQKHAKGVLVRLSIESANRALIIKKLVDMLSDKGSSAQEQAAAAIANLASDSTENRTSIVDAGGVAPLLSLLEGGTPKAKENSIASISKLAES